jgi:hypothetical protein
MKPYGHWDYDEEDRSNGYWDDDINYCYEQRELEESMDRYCNSRDDDDFWNPNEPEEPYWDDSYIPELDDRYESEDYETFP